MEDQGFLEKHYSVFVSRVKSVMPIADKLFKEQIICEEEYLQIKAKNTSHDQMRIILCRVMQNALMAKSCLVKVLKEEEPLLCQELEESSSQTSPGVLQSQEADPIRWNRYSIKHRSKIEELLKDGSRQWIGSILISKNDKYLIVPKLRGKQIYLGLKRDGTEVAIKRIIKNNENFENEVKLCEYDLEGYMDELRKEETENKVTALKKVVKEVLLGLQVLHRAKVIHRDIKPQNILIDSEKNARLADFGISRRLEDDKSTVYTARAGTKCWEAVETLDQTEKTGYKRSSDVQVAGMLLYYILSDGKHPFEGNNLWEQEAKIREGNYSLDKVDDVVAKDLIERMINKVPEKRPTIHEALNHPYFWDDVRKKTVLSNLGERKEVQYYEDLGKLYSILNNGSENGDGKDPTAEQITEACNKIPAERREDILKLMGEDLTKLPNLCDTAKKYTNDKTFSRWKTDLSEIWNDISTKLPEDLIGLLRALCNKMKHAQDEFYGRNMLNHFPDFFISLYGLAKDLSWKIDDAEEKP
ncbi:uncharacterized protein [Paramisgurnus dabryanus]|uniref:uncharacterized protein isoform X2 n=1 Tax=Paramisgurnus dabryanus TaxID=90735 RepID=UPI0031F3872F